MLAVTCLRHPFHHHAGPDRRAKSAQRQAKIGREIAGPAKLGRASGGCQESRGDAGTPAGGLHGNEGKRRTAIPVGDRPSGRGTHTEALHAQAVTGPVSHAIDGADWLSPPGRPRNGHEPADPFRMRVSRALAPNDLPDCGVPPNRHDRPRPSRAEFRGAEA